MKKQNKILNIPMYIPRGWKSKVLKLPFPVAYPTRWDKKFLKVKLPNFKKK
jgi:hypothetical protein